MKSIIGPNYPMNLTLAFPIMSKILSWDKHSPNVT